MDNIERNPMGSETEMYNTTCKHEFEEIKGLLADLKEKTDDTHKKLYVGNGHPPISVQLDRLNCFKKFSYWFYGLMTVTSIGLVTKLILELFK